jgi:hypothetical protein
MGCIITMSGEPGEQMPSKWLVFSGYKFSGLTGATFSPSTSANIPLAATEAQRTERVSPWVLRR